MITFKKVKVCFLLIFIFFNIFYIAPCYSLSLREDLFKNALDLSSGGKFNLALQEWNQYLDSYPDDAAIRVYNYLHSMTLEAQLLARACGKTNIHSLEPEDLAALTSEASALAEVPLAGTNYTVGVDNYHKI